MVSLLQLLSDNYIQGRNYVELLHFLSPQSWTIDWIWGKAKTLFYIQILGDWAKQCLYQSLVEIQTWVKNIHAQEHTDNTQKQSQGHQHIFKKYKSFISIKEIYNYFLSIDKQIEMSTNQFFFNL